MVVKINRNGGNCKQGNFPVKNILTITTSYTNELGLVFGEEGEAWKRKNYIFRHWDAR
jgi:hypothetical protein